MVKINISSSGNRLTLTAKGHAEYSSYGNDIVCSAVSILLYTLVGNIETVQTDKGLREAPIISLNSGNTKIECVAHDKPTFSKLEQMFKFAEVGFSMLQDTYPGYVSMISTIGV